MSLPQQADRAAPRQVPRPLHRSVHQAGSQPHVPRALDPSSCSRVVHIRLNTNPPPPPSRRPPRHASLGRKSPRGRSSDLFAKPRPNLAVPRALDPIHASLAKSRKIVPQATLPTSLRKNPWIHHPCIPSEKFERSFPKPRSNLMSKEAWILSTRRWPKVEKLFCNPDLSPFPPPPGKEVDL